MQPIPPPDEVPKKMEIPPRMKPREEIPGVKEIESEIVIPPIEEINIEQLTDEKVDEMTSSLEQEEREGALFLALAEKLDPDEKLVVFKAEAGVDFIEAASGVRDLAQGVIEVGEGLIVHKIMEKIVEPLADIGELAEETLHHAANIKFIFEAGDTIGQSAALIFKKAIIKSVKEEYQAKNMEMPPKVKEWVAEQEKELKEKIKETIIEKLHYIPSAVKTGLRFFGKLKGTAAYGVTWAIIITEVASSSYMIYVGTKGVKKQEAWLEKIKEKPILAEDLKQLIAKRKAAFEERTKTMDEETARKEDTKAALTRNALRALTQKKHDAELSYSKFKLNKEKVSLVISSILFVTILVLETLALVGLIVIPAAALASTGVGAFVLGVALIAAGLIYLYKTRPNLFKTLITGTQFKLAFFKIPEAFNRFRLKRNRIRELRLSLEQTPKATEKMKKQAEKIKQKEKELTEKVEKWESKVKPLQEKITTAKWKDYWYSVKKDENAADVLIEGLSIKDSDTQTLFKERFGVDLEALEEKPKIEEIREGLKTFFTMDETEVIKFIKKQQRMLEGGSPA